MRARLARLIERSWYGDGGITLLLLPLAWLYQLIVSVRRWLYSRDLLQRPALPVPVVVVGNITVGGTGKSPLTAWLVEQLQQAGFSPGIVSRGYGGTVRGAPVMVTAASSAAEVGDEPVMLARQTEVPVCVCPDRVAAVGALAAAGVDVVVADDGLQHYRMRRVAEVLVLDGRRMFGNGYLLPAGPLRESPSRTGDVDAVCINGEPGAQPGLHFSLQPQGLRALDGEARRDLRDMSGMRVWSLAGIGNPQRFHDMLRSRGLEIDPVEVGDHDVANLDALLAERSQPVIMTSKDAVKYPGKRYADCWYVPVSLEFRDDGGRQLMEKILARLRAATKD